MSTDLLWLLLLVALVVFVYVVGYCDGKLAMRERDTFERLDRIIESLRRAGKKP